MVVGIHKKAQSQLLDVACTLGPSGRFPGSGENREQDGGQDRDNRNNHQKLKEGEPRGSAISGERRRVQKFIHGSFYLEKRLQQRNQECLFS